MSARSRVKAPHGGTEHSFEGHRGRLKDLLVRGSDRSITDAELLELLLAYAIPRRDVLPIARGLLERFEDLGAVLSASLVEMTQVPGIGRHTAVLLRLVRTIVTRLGERPARSCEVLRTPGEMAGYARARLANARNEALLLIFLDKHRVILGEETMGSATVNEVVVFPREVVQAALRHNATAMVIAHNHPHGPPLPSVRDRDEAERLRAVLQPLDIELVDAIVVGRTRCFSIFGNTMV